MDTMSAWEAQTQELLKRVEKEMEQVQSEADRLLAELEERRWALDIALTAYREMHGESLAQTAQGLSVSDIRNKSHREILRFIAKQNKGLLVAKQAIRIMKEAGVFGNPDNADSAVYSVLKRSPEFVKVGKGVYKANGGKEKPKSHLKRPRGKKRIASGVVEAIKSIKEEHPEMTKREIRNALTSQGFDFKGKKPGNAVNMAWVRLGYPSERPYQMELDAKRTALANTKDV